MVGDTGVADRFRGTAVGEEDAFVRGHAGASGDDSASAACAGEPHEIGPQRRGSGDEESAGDEGDLELHSDWLVASRAAKKKWGEFEIIERLVC